jgi:hypothetical protein
MPAVTKFLGIARGVELDARPTVGESTSSLAIELAILVDDGAGVTMTRAEALAGLEAIRGALAVSPWPPS